MIFGLTTSTYTLVHVLISLVGIASGLVVLGGMFSGKRLAGWTALFLATTAATSVTGFGFPFDHLLPSHKVGIVSLAALALAILARYVLNLTGVWRLVYVVSAVVSLYLNCFVLVVQAFLRVPALKAMAPKQTEPPFVIAQGVLFAVFVLLGAFAALRFHPDPFGAARARAGR